MFDIGWTEILIVVVVAIIVVGPKDLPPMLRATGRMVAKLRRTAGEFQGQFNEALREAELDGVKESIDQIRSLNPMNEIKKQLDPIQSALESPSPIAKPAPEPVVPSMGQDARPVSNADMEPAAPAPEIAPPAPSVEAPAAETTAAETVKPKRTRKPKAAAEAGPSVGEAEAPAPTPKTRARKPATVDGEPAAPKPQRAPRKKTAPPAATVDAEAAATSDTTSTPEGRNA